MPSLFFCVFHPLCKILKRMNDAIGIILFALVLFLVSLVQLRWLFFRPGKKLILPRERNIIGTQKKIHITQKDNTVVLHNGSVVHVRECDHSCGVCGKVIKYDSHRLVAYETFSVCYYCWKLWNFINTKAKVFFLLEGHLPKDVLRLVENFVLDNFWEIPQFAVQFHSQTREILTPHFIKFITLDLPKIFNNEGKVISWLFPRHNKITLYFSDYGTYSLYQSNYLNRKMRSIEFEKETNEENLSETFQLINQLQKLYS